MITSAIYLAGIATGAILQLLVDYAFQRLKQRLEARAQEAERVRLDLDAEQAQRDIRAFFESALAASARNPPPDDCQCKNCTKRRKEATDAKRSN